MALIVNEIFHSIQGESIHAGRPCVFVRLTGCNLRCRYCDTAYAYDEGRLLPLEQIVDQVSSFGCGLVEITGGEPLLQTETPRLAARLLDLGYEVLIETNGSRDIGSLDSRCVRIVDMKCPSSGEEPRNDYGNLSRLTPRDQLKFVMADAADYAYARKILRERRPAVPPSQILFSPVTGVLNPALLARWILTDGLDVRLHLQLHAVIWPDATRGV
ncbi:7-carboxy-7-deazaguanine synthase QueE [Desulfatiferula olefinivorans]